MSKEIRRNNASTEQKRCGNCDRVGHFKKECRLPGGGAHQLGNKVAAHADLTAAVKAAMEQELAPIKKKLAEMEGDPKWWSGPGGS